MKNAIRDYFHYNRSERNGFFVLALLCIFGFLVPSIFRQFAKSTSTDFNQYQSEIASFESALNSNSETKEFSEKDGSNVKKELFYFDPNTASEKELNRLGLSPKVVRTLLNFRSKGGKFFKPEDLQKIYGLSTADYQSLKNYIQISKTDYAGQNKFQPKKSEAQEVKKTERILFSFDPNTASRSDLEKLGFPKRAANNLIKFRSKGGTFRKREELAKIYGIDETFFEKLFPFISIPTTPKKKTETTNANPKPPARKEQIVSIDVNSATVEEWQKIRGIGPAFSSRITNFRDKLGGFHSINQIAETYGLPDSVFQKILPLLKLQTPHQKLNLNTATVTQLAAHPYLKKKQADIIINYRTQHGNFQSTDDLNNIHAFSPALIQKIKPYLSIE